MNLIRFLLCLVCSTFILVTCTRQKKEPPAGGPDSTFVKLSEQFLKGYFAFRPATATYLGLHEYDRSKRDYSHAGLQAELTRLKDFEQRITSLQGSVSKKTGYDLRLLQSAIRQEIFAFEDLKVY